VNARKNNMERSPVKPEIVIDAPAELALVFADRFAAEVRAAIAARKQFSCALPGGSVAETFFPVLARAPVAWDQVEFFWGDERAVGPDDPDSNYGLAKRLLLDPVRADPRRIHRIAGEGGDLEAAARAYEEEMVRALGDPPRIDLVVLGLGPEGHVCSLFPGHPLLRERFRRVAAITDSPKPPPRRVTFTMLPLELAETVCVAGFGDSKAEAIRAAVEEPDSQIPVALAIRAARRALVLVDPAAACLLRGD
jgi:6-phosphogluconolactonase